MSIHGRDRCGEGRHDRYKRSGFRGRTDARQCAEQPPHREGSCGYAEARHLHVTFTTQFLPVVEVGRRRPFLFPIPSLRTSRSYQRSHGRQSGIRQWRCERRECGRQARSRRHRRSSQIHLCRRGSICWSAWRRHQHHCFLRTEHLIVIPLARPLRIAIGINKYAVAKKLLG